MSTRELRDYQLEAVEKIEGAWADGMLRPAIVLPTGTGKTDVIARIATDAARAGKRVLAVAHRGELLDQITERCGMHAPDIAVGRVQASRNQTRRPITVAMSQTLASDKRRAKMPRPDVVIVDEAHHAASPSQMAILRWAGSFDHTRTMGVTATMVRGDKRKLGDVWQDVVFERDIKWAVESGWLVKPRGKAVVISHMDLNQAKVSRGDYQDNELGEMVSQDVDQIVQAWLEHAKDRITIAFTPNVDSAVALSEEFERAGVPVETVFGSTGATDRAAAYQALAAGQTQVLVGVMVMTEGWDCPPVSCVLQARPTQLPGLYQQMIGRGLRPSPDKDDCLVLDVVGTSRNQKLVTLIDLSESVEYDTRDLDILPCAVCGGALRGQELTDLAPYQCTCLVEPGERDPDGGRIKLQGPAEYEDVDFFATSRLNWLFTHGGVRFLPCGDRMVFLWPEDDGTYWPGHCTVRGYDNGRYVGKDAHPHPAGPMPLEEARTVAEHFALSEDSSLASKGSSWRKGGQQPSVAQVALAHKLGITAPTLMSKARLSDEISIAYASAVID